MGIYRAYWKKFGCLERKTRRIDTVTYQLDYILDPIKLARLGVQLQYIAYEPFDWVTAVSFYWFTPIEKEKLN